MSYHLKVLIVGAGGMSQAYHKILKSMGIEPVVVCRTQSTADEFHEITGGVALSGGLDKWLSENKLDESWKVIIATPVEVLAENITSLLKNGAKDILVEKPGFLKLSEGQQILKLQNEYVAKVHIGYNRRFYTSVLEAEKIIENDGGLKSVHFEFTEWAHVIAPLEKGAGVKEKWFLANSTHVVDLVFYLTGLPVEYSFKAFGTLDWHPSASVFVGSGITEKNVTFSYHSNWEAPGRWAIEFITNQHRIYLKPMEKLSIQVKGSVAVNEFKMDDSLDIDYKPGLYRMVESFLSDEYSRLVSIEKQIQLYRIYSEIANYEN